MKLRLKLPLLIGLVVVFSTAITVLMTERAASSQITNLIYYDMHTLARLNAQVISLTINNRLVQLVEVANQPEVRTLDWEGYVYESLSAAVARTESQDLGLVLPNGHAVFTNGDVINIAAQGVFNIAMTGQPSAHVGISIATGEMVGIFIVPVFAHDGANAPVIAGVVSRRDVEDVQNIITDMEFAQQSAYAVLINPVGTVIGHPNINIVLSEFNAITASQADPTLIPLAEMMGRALVEPAGYGRFVMGGQNMLSTFSQVPDLPWSLLIVIEESDALAYVLYIRVIMLIIGAITGVVGITIAIFLGLSIAKPVVTIANTLEGLGDGDFTKRIKINSKDEIGALANGFNTTLDKICELIKNVKEEAKILSDIGDNLAANMNETAAAVNEITATISSIKGRVMNQSSSVMQTSSTMEELVRNINNLNDHVESQSNNISKASSSIEQMVANVNSVTNTLVNNSSSVKTLKDASEVGRTGLQEVAENIKEISSESEGLLEINAVMENIASQTNLLSMNAAIEAAHAGDAGKGFAVVADEIRKLAESSSEQSKIISTVLKKIKESIDKITRSTDNVLDKFEAIDSNVQTVAMQGENIRYAMEEQGQGSRQVLDSISGITEITYSVKKGSNEMQQSASGVQREGEKLEKATQEITSGMNEMANGAEQINIAVNHVNDLSGQNSQAIDVLIKEVARFKVE
ncbi:MAG: methyl-accepting chemotaxis protein [Spirochaetes bacterium]|nr:methyl-accepting chemotaxis protein [Spirochaetota bacterium]